MSNLAYSRTYPLDRRFSVSFTLADGRLDCVWSPHSPKGRKARSLLPVYRIARNDFIRSLGIPALVVEI